MALTTLTATGGGCVHSENATAEIADAAAAKAVAETATELADQPDICRQHLDRPSPARVKSGGPAWADIAAWETAADAADRRVDFCAADRDRMREAYSRTAGTSPR
ncbi:hypothetical protein ACQQ2Q_21505 [Agrobacterium sp. ES01]|uniref:hypothetical protein n=1 Tax=Agrobacterium sp. ES01 TaxID=3420714 RepID=UPI003D096A48